jgi:hypothetical protein
MNLKLKMELMEIQHSKTESKMAVGSNTGTPGKTTSTSRFSATSFAVAPQTRKLAPVAIASVTADKLTKREQKNLAVRKEIIAGAQEEIVELDGFIKAKSGATGIVDPEDAKLRRKLVRNLNELKKLFFPKPKVLTDAEQAEVQAALRSWNKYRKALLKKQPVSH